MRLCCRSPSPATDPSGSSALRPLAAKTRRPQRTALADAGLRLFVTNGAGLTRQQHSPMRHSRGAPGMPPWESCMLAVVNTSSDSRSPAPNTRGAHRRPASGIDRWARMRLRRDYTADHRSDAETEQLLPAPRRRCQGSWPCQPLSQPHYAASPVSSRCRSSTPARRARAIAAKLTRCAWFDPHLGCMRNLGADGGRIASAG